jgi:hypothetical protein
LRILSDRSDRPRFHGAPSLGPVAMLQTYACLIILSIKT